MRTWMGFAAFLACSSEQALHVDHTASALPGADSSAPQNATCGNSLYARVCACPSGKSADGATCLSDVGPSVTGCSPSSGVGPCGPNALCADTAEGFTCSCTGATSMTPREVMLADTTFASENGFVDIDGFDFTRHQYVGHASGDFYIYQKSFFADAPKQNGLVDLGACDTPAQFIGALPQSGYVTTGVPIVDGDCYSVIPRGDNSAPHVIIKVVSSFDWTDINFVIDGVYCSPIDACQANTSPAGCPTTDECVERNGIFTCVDNPCAQGNWIDCVSGSCQIAASGESTCSGPPIDACTASATCDAGYVCQNGHGGSYECVVPEPN